MSEKAKSEKLVFVLGAGASAHFGYPLGNELVDAMEAFSKTIQPPLDVETRREISGFIEHIKSYNPLNIDYYLYNHPYKAIVGKKLLEATLLNSQYESVYSAKTKLRKWWKEAEGAPAFTERFKDYENRPKEPDDNFFPAWNWVKFIHHKIVVNCKTVEDVERELKDIFVITFNYDLSFEKALQKYFEGTIFGEENTSILPYLRDTFFKDNVIHVYRSIASTDVQFVSTKREDMAEARISIFEQARGDMDVIGVHKPGHKGAQNFLKNAHRVYFLGYAFDEFNNRVLNLKNVLRDNTFLDAVFYTNMDDSLICDSSMRGCFDGYHIKLFGADGRITQAFPLKNMPKFINISKSRRNVYEALEKDLSIVISKDHIQ